MDKFLEVCFKIGKGILFVLIILCFICVIGSAISIPQTFKKIDVVNPTFNQIYAQSQAAKTNNTVKTDEPYITEFQNMAKLYFTEYGKKIFWAKIQSIDPKYRLQYVKGADVVLSDMVSYGRENKLNDKWLNDLFDDVVNGYDIEFKTNIITKETAEAQQKFQRITAFGSICSSILLFILFLCIALLIKIEENTRK